MRVDYLAPGGEGTVVAIEETPWIDAELDEIAALAFDADSRRIACLADGGRVDVLPVP